MLNRSFNLLHIRVPKRRTLITSETELTRALLQTLHRGHNFRIQSSGHCFAGHSQSRETLIDLRKLNAVSVDPDAQTITLGAAANVGDVISATAPHGLALPAGYCQTVSMGGHVTGGGIGVLSRRYGLACDHLLSVRMLTANGKIINVSNEENADLFWALRGGGASSFGVVSQMTLQLRKPGAVAMVKMELSLPPARAAKWITYWQQLAAGADPKFNFHLDVQNHVDGKILLRPRLVSSASNQETHDMALAVSQFDELLKLPKISQGSFAQISDQLWKRSFFPQDRNLITSAYQKAPLNPSQWSAILTKLQTHSNSGFGFSIEGLGGAINDLSSTATAYPHRRGSQFLIQIHANGLSNPPAAEENLWFDTMVEAFESGSTHGAYFNYPQRDLPNWARRYWGENLERLVEIKNKWDPKNVFHHGQSIPLKIPS